MSLADEVNATGVLITLRRCVGQGFAMLRHMTGDDAYERYVIHQQQHHADQVLLDRRAYYLTEQQRKWTGVKRCC